MCLCVVVCVCVCVYLILRYLTLIISNDEILRMAAQFFISLSWLFWAVMYPVIFILRTYFVNLIQFWGTNKVVVVVVVFEDQKVLQW